MLGGALLIIACVAMLHAAFSTYEHLSHLKALGRPEGTPPIDVIAETFVALILATFGATLRTEELKEITWRSEMKKRSLDDVDPRLSFATFAQRAGLQTASKPEKS